MPLGDRSPKVGQRRIHCVHARAEIRLPLLRGRARPRRRSRRPALGVRSNIEPSGILRVNGRAPPEHRNDSGSRRTGFHHHAPSLKRCPTAVQDCPPTRGSRGAVCRRLTPGIDFASGARPDAVSRPMPDHRRGVAARAKSRQSITTTVYILQGVARHALAGGPQSP